MNILIPDSWLREFLTTNASPKEVSDALTLCGPTVDRLTRVKGDYIYEIEVTSNRVDMMSVYGIAREATAILPRFGKKAKLKPLTAKIVKDKKKLEIVVVDKKKLTNRTLAIKLEDVVLDDSPDWLKDRLIKTGQRPLSNAIDITNYIMWEVGHPIHVFDYDKIINKKIVVRLATKGEKLTTLDNKIHTMIGGEVVFDDGEGNIIDLPGIMGTVNTVVTKETQNILLWIEDIDASKIRKTAMSHAIRTQAATLNEKHVDSELGKVAILRATELFIKIAKAKVASNLLDVYNTPYKTKKVSVKLNFVHDRLGIKIAKSDITKYLSPLGFTPKWKGGTLTINIPSFRKHDINIPEDIVEEVARIYGYNNLPGTLMASKLAKPIPDTPFEFENDIKNTLKGYGGVEVYTSSLVAKTMVGKSALSLKNPLGDDKGYLRTTLIPSLTNAIKQNSGEKEPFWLFEMANIYLPKKNDLPEERMMLGSIFSDINYRSIKGIVEAFLDSLNIKAKFIVKDEINFTPGRSVVIKSKDVEIGQLGVLEEKHKYFEFNLEKLRSVSSKFKTYRPIPKYPAQIEDITLKLPQKTKLQEVIHSIESVDIRVNKLELIDTYKDSFTFRIWYLDKSKTLKDSEVKEIRKKIVKTLRTKYGARQK